MYNSVSHSVKFLKDENVKKRLETFLKQKGIDIISKPKGFLNGKLASFSKAEKRVLITNNEDFVNSEHFPKEKIFSVVWLRIPQRKIESAKNTFSRLLKETKPENFEGNLIILYEDKFTIESIPSAEE